MPSALLHSLALAFAAAAAPAPAPAPPTADGRDDPLAAEVRETLAKGDAEAALAQALRSLEEEPQSWALLDAASESALAAGRSDEALHLARLALAELPAGDRALEPTRQAIAARAAGLDPLAARRQATLDAFAETVFRLAEFAKGRKFYANAVDVYLRCAGSAHEERALRALDKLYENDKALTALLDSGIDVPVETEELRKSPEWIAAEDAKHKDFEEPHEAKSDLYTIRSNSGYLLTHQVLRAMEQMNYFLREMFDYKTRGGGMRRAFIDIHASKQEFMDMHNLGANIGGFFSPSENRIVSYDSRPQGDPLNELWNTLFHEGTHQFVHAISPNLVPAWVNEGTACYFEGTRMLPNGKVEANLIPPSRLESLVQLMDAEAVDVVDVITYFAPGSYSGQFYPYGWGLVYFLRNFEDETGERVYLPFFNEYVATYQSGGNHDVLERWLDYFVREPKRPGIDSLEAWMEQWEAWIRDLHAIHFGGSEQADVLITRARQQVERGKPDHAVETFRWATRKRPGDPAATFGLAEVLAAIGQEDAAIYYYRQAGAWADAQPDADAEVPGFDELTAGELSERCLARIGAIYPKLVEGFSDARAKFVDEVRALAEEYAAADLPRAALQVLADAERAVGGQRGLAEARAAVLADAPIEIRRRRRLDLSDGLAAWSGVSDEWRVEGDGLAAQGEGLNTIVYGAELPPSYRFEATLEVVNRGQSPSVVGLAFGANVGGRQMVAWMDPGQIVRVRLEPTEGGTRPVVADRLKGPFVPEGAFRMAVEVRPAEAEFFLDGESIGRVAFAREELEGGVGLFFQNARVLITEPRLLY